MDMENNEFCRDNFEVKSWWTAETTVGLFFPISVAYYSYFYAYRECNRLWKANEREHPAPTEPMLADMTWLR